MGWRTFRDRLAILFGLSILTMVALGLRGILTLDGGWGAALGSWLSTIIYFYFRKSGPSQPGPPGGGTDATPR